ncbi:MAG: hypothetical protein ACPL1Y_05955 [Thermoplasmata archaeon]
MPQNLIIPAETIRMWQQILFKKGGESGLKEHWFLVGRLNGLAIAKDLLGKGKLEDHISAIEALWRGCGYSKIKIEIREDGVHVHLAELFPEFFPERPYAAGILAGMIVYVTGETYTSFITIQKGNITEIVLQREDEKKPLMKEVEEARKSVVTAPIEENFEEEEIAETEEIEPSCYEAYLDENSLEIGKVNIIESNEKARAIITQLSRFPSCRILYITQTHPKHVRRNFPELHQIIWLKEESAEKGEGYIVISPSRIEHQLVQVPKEFILKQKEENKEAVIVITHIEPFKFTLTDWEAKFVKYITKINNLCADYDAIALLQVDPEGLPAGFISTLRHVLS